MIIELQPNQWDRFRLGIFRNNDGAVQILKARDGRRILLAHGVKGGYASTLAAALVEVVDVVVACYPALKPDTSKCLFPEHTGRLFINVQYGDLVVNTVSQNPGELV